VQCREASRAAIVYMFILADAACAIYTRDVTRDIFATPRAMVSARRAVTDMPPTMFFMRATRPAFYAMIHATKYDYFSSR